MAQNRLRWRATYNKNICGCYLSRGTKVTLMQTLLYLDILGILVSFLIHLCLLLGFSLPSGTMAIVLNVGLYGVVGVRLRITKELRQGNEWFFAPNMKNLCPRRLKVLVGVICVYGMFILIISIRVVYLTVVNADFSTTMEETTTASRNLHIGGFALIMMCYALESLVLYLYTRIKIKADRQEEQGLA